jgi:2-haloacid dehalogenase
MSYEWLLFDADGTLFDYDRAETIALKRAFEQMGWPFAPEYAYEYRRINERIWLDFEEGRISQDRLRTLRFEKLFEAIGVELAPEAFSTRYLGCLAEGIDLIDGAEEVVRALYGRVGLVLITNGLQDVQRPRLTGSAIGAYFSDVVISEEVGAAKPQRAIFEFAFQKMGQPPLDRVLIVGDSLTSDIQGGNNFGIDTCWFNPHDSPRDPAIHVHYEIRDLRELLSLVGMAGGR